MTESSGDTGRRRHLALGVGLLVVGVAAWLLLRGGGRTEQIMAPAPTVEADTELSDTLAPSSLSVPVRISLQTLLNEVEDAVPMEFGTDEHPIEIPDAGRTHAKIALRRSPFRAELVGSVARMATTIEYSLDATYDLPLLPDLNLGCGTDEDRPRPRLDVAVHAPIELTSDWTLLTEAAVDHVTAASSEERDRCEVTFAGFDVTGSIEGAARSFLEGHTETIDSIVATADLRSSFAGWWDELRNPIGLDDGLWLEIRPERIRRGEVDGSGAVVVVGANLEARPRILLGEQPPIWSTELPPLESGSSDGGLDILLEAVAEYEQASRRLTEALSGVEVEGAGQRVQVVALEVTGIGGGRVALQADVSGDVFGRLYLVGTPVWNAETRQVSVPDLEFSVETTNLLVAGASRALHDRLSGMLRERATWPVDDALEWAGDILAEGLNRELADGVWLSGSAQEVGIIGVAAMTHGLIVRATATAEATLQVDRGN